MPRAIRGVLATCEPAIKSIIVHLDSERSEFIIEDLDETHLVLKEGMVSELRRRLEEVHNFSNVGCVFCRPESKAAGKSLVCSMALFHTAV